MPKFRDIPQMPRARYQIDIPWTDLEDTVQHHVDEYKLNLEPDFQRAHVWTPAQQRRYVEYILQGGEVGKNLVFNCPGWMHGDIRDDYCIVDGKQRLEAVRAFLRGEVEVFGYRFRDYTDQLGLCGPGFKWQVCELKTRAELLQLYLNINAGGTPHTKREIDRVRDMFVKAQAKELTCE